MKVIHVLHFILLAFAGNVYAEEKASTSRLDELDKYWNEVSRAVAAGDFEAYKATCHSEGVLVSGSKKTSHSLSDALARWKQGFENTRRGKMKAAVAFRFSQRLGNETTAHETGMFAYSTEDAEGNRTREFIHFEALLVKRGGKWLILMEYQKTVGTKQEWDALAKK